MKDFKTIETKKIQTKSAQQKTPLEMASAYLANRMRTVLEMKEYLQNKGCTNKEITYVIDELKELKYLDDNYYAVRYFEYNHGKNRGSLRAIRELEEKGVDGETIKNAYEDYVYENSIDEFAEALNLARKELYYMKEDGSGRVIRRELDEKLMAKIARKLERSGFQNEHIYRVLGELRK